MVAVGLSKLVVVSINVIFMIFGLACLVVGIIFKLSWDDVKDAFDSSVDDVELKNVGETVGVAVIIFGTFILVVAVLGCLGALCKLRPMLAAYGTILIILLVAELGVVCYGAVKGEEAEDSLKKALGDTVKGYREDSGNSKSKAWSAIFELGVCCGVTDYTKDMSDFVKDNPLRTQAAIPAASNIPVTCCKGVDYESKLTADVFKDHSQCLTKPTSGNAHIDGCYTILTDWISHAKGVLIGVGVAILLIELLLAVMSFFLCCRADD